MSRHFFDCFKLKSIIECSNKQASDANSNKYSSPQLKEKQSNETSQAGKNTSKSLENISMNGKKNQSKYSIKNSEKISKSTMHVNGKYFKKAKSNMSFENDDILSNSDITELKFPKSNLPKDLDRKTFDNNVLNEVLVCSQIFIFFIH